MPSGPRGINGYSISANGPVIRADPSDVARALREVNEAIFVRLTALETQNARLLAYVRAAEWINQAEPLTMLPIPQDDLAAWEVARDALIDAGDLMVDAAAENSTDAARASHPDAETARSTTPDAVRALAVLDRLWALAAVTSVTMWRECGACVVKAMIDAGPVGSLRGEGETPAAALLALGARLEAGNDGHDHRSDAPESTESDGRGRG